jgi:hypothetical protein
MMFQMRDAVRSTLLNPLGYALRSSCNPLNLGDGFAALDQGYCVARRFEKKSVEMAVGHIPRR